MYKFLTKNGQLIALVLGAVISIIFILIVLSASSTEGLGADTFSNMEMADVKAQLASLTQFDFGLFATYALLVITALIAVLFGLYHFVMNAIDNPKSVLQTVIMIVGILVLFFIARGMAPADSQAVLSAREEFQVNDSQSGFISGAITTTVIVILLAVVTLVVAEVRNAFK